MSRSVPLQRAVEPQEKSDSLGDAIMKVIIEKHSDGYVAYPVGPKGVVVGQGATCDEALRDVTSAIQFHVETFGSAVLEGETEVLDVFVADVQVA